MSDQKDRYGEKIHDVEAARENQWAQQRDAELLSKMREKLAASVACPRCKRPLEAHVEGGIEMLSCSEGHGAWLDKATIDRLVQTQK
jgi:uncharacterized protein YbaR (Trm112 family)